jgi:hypothetical protein
MTQKTYGRATYKNPPTSPASLKAVEQKLHLALVELVNFRARNLGECHSREALPEALAGLLRGVSPLARIAAAGAILEQTAIESPASFTIHVDGNAVIVRAANDPDPALTKNPRFLEAFSATDSD